MNATLEESCSQLPYIEWVTKLVPRAGIGPANGGFSILSVHQFTTWAYGDDDGDRTRDLRSDSPVC